MGVGSEQRVGGRVVGVEAPIRDREAQRFQPRGAGFRDCGDYDIGVLCNVVLLHRDYGINFFWLTPKVLI